MEAKQWPGRSYPLGATWTELGVNFAIFSENATAVELCLFDEDGDNERRIPLREQTGFVWHTFIPGIKAGQLYGYRMNGPYAPHKGHRFNPHKLLLDPYARAVAGQPDQHEAIFGYRIGAPDKDLSFSDEDSAPSMSKSVVIASRFDWTGDTAPDIPWHNSIIYEVHVKGFTIRNPRIPEELRGTYAGLGCEASIRYLQELGVTAVELLPVHDFLDEGHLVERGLSNYWGYNTNNFFAPDARYSSSGDRGGQVDEFKAMVKALHAAGIEVILDVVYNHTSEGNELGPTISFKGLDNAAYYRLVPEDHRFYMNFTGTGNSLNTRHPQVLKLIMDSLRYWVEEMHVDGFRFDLASTLARELHDVDRLGSFFDTIHQDPVLSRVKLIAEPWDVGAGGYQVGNFPVSWAEWNDKYRDTMRRFWRGDEDQMAELGWRLTGSSDLYQGDGRHPYNSINFITAHDGFTLQDLVCFNHKHNEANGENNADGNDNNLSYNYGVEGYTDDPATVRLRDRQKRNFLTTLFVSQGTPMLCGGDEIGRSQGGNNNAYCQDNEISWFNWTLDEGGRELLKFTRELIAFRRAHRVLSRSKFFKGRRIRGSDVSDISWHQPDAQPMTDQEWDAPWVRTLGIVLGGDGLDEYDEEGTRIIDDTMLLLFNAHAEPVPFTLPGDAENEEWELILDTRTPEFLNDGPRHAAASVFDLESRSIALFKRIALKDSAEQRRSVPAVDRRQVGSAS